MKTVSILILSLLCVSPLLTAETIAEYPVRWDRGVENVYGRLIITTESVTFIPDEGETRSFPMLYLDEVKLMDERWVQVITTTESGLSFWLDDKYNFGVIGETVDPQVIERLNRLIVGAREVRVQSAARLPGERNRYMVAKGETVGDDVGLLIITENGIKYTSDTGGRDHNWNWEDLKGVEINRDGRLVINTTERAIIKLGLSTRNYSFVSMASPFKSSDIAFIMDNIAASAPAQ